MHRRRLKLFCEIILNQVTQQWKGPVLLKVCGKQVIRLLSLQPGNRGTLFFLFGERREGTTACNYSIVLLQQRTNKLRWFLTSFSECDTSA